MFFLYVFLLGVLTGLAFAKIFGSSNYVVPEDDYKCPHGYRDWDGCPDCRH